MRIKGRFVRHDAGGDLRRLLEGGVLAVGIGVGSVVLFLNATFLGGYTFGCHALRHLVGGGFDCMSCGEETVRYGAWKRVSWLNARHNRFAWMSLVWVGFTDVYVRMVSMGVITDLNTWTN